MTQTSGANHLARCAAPDVAEVAGKFDRLDLARCARPNLEEIVHLFTYQVLPNMPYCYDMYSNSCYVLFSHGTVVHLFALPTEGADYTACKRLIDAGFPEPGQYGCESITKALLTGQESEATLWYTNFPSLASGGTPNGWAGWGIHTLCICDNYNDACASGRVGRWADYNDPVVYAIIKPAQIQVFY